MGEYLGRGEGGLYENVLSAIEARNPKFKLNIRRGPTAALANAIIAEAKAGVRRSDVFWAVDSGAIGVVSEAGLARKLPQDLVEQLQPEFRYDNWAPVTGYDLVVCNPPFWPAKAHTVPPLEERGRARHADHPADRL